MLHYVRVAWPHIRQSLLWEMSIYCKGIIGPGLMTATPHIEHGTGHHVIESLARNTFLMGVPGSGKLCG